MIIINDDWFSVFRICIRSSIILNGECSLFFFGVSSFLFLVHYHSFLAFDFPFVVSIISLASVYWGLPKNQNHLLDIAIWPDTQWNHTVLDVSGLPKASTFGVAISFATAPKDG